MSARSATNRRVRSGRTNSFTISPERVAKMIRTVTLALTPEQAERLALAQNEGKLTIGMRNLRDKQIIRTAGATRDTLLGATPRSAARAQNDGDRVDRQSHEKRRLQWLRRAGVHPERRRVGRAQRAEKVRATSWTSSRRAAGMASR
jgi:Flp pilus assembly protein RcpC/CpaB